MSNTFFDIQQWSSFISNLIYKPNNYLKNYGVGNEQLTTYYIDEIKGLLEKNAIVITEEKNEKLGFALFRPSVFDSTILQKKVGKVDYISVAAGVADETVDRLVQKLILSFTEQDLDYVTCRLSASDIDLIHGLERNGFVLVDEYLVLLQELDQVFEEDEEEDIREAREEDIEALQNTIASTFIYSRFFRDNLVGKKAATDMHAEWIKNSILKKVADDVYVTEIDNKAAGFVTLEVDPDMKKYFGLNMGHIPLIGVDPVYRGHHLAAKMTSFSLQQYFAKRDIQYVRIETQMINVPATRTYEKLGFRMVDSALTFRWSKK